MPNFLRLYFIALLTILLVACGGGGGGGGSDSEGGEPAPESPPTNSEPTLTITSPTDSTSVEEGTTLTFSGTAQDAEDGNISVNIVWNSSLDGQITNSTTLSIGTHTITASVRDNGGLMASDQVTLTVTAAPASTTSVTLSWTIPSARENGDSLELYEIGGYEIQYKKAGDALYYSETVSESQTSQHVVTNLEAGDYEFKIAAYDVNGLYSQYNTTTASVQ